MNWKDILIIILALVSVALIMSTTCTSRKLSISNNNIKALTDTVEEYRLKNNELMYEKQGYILEKQELEKYLGISKNEVKDLERKLNSSLAAISKLKAEMRVDTIRIQDSIYITQDSTYHSIFRYRDEWLSLNGETQFSVRPVNASTTINDISMTASLKVGMSKDDKWFATSDNPYLKFTAIDGANIEKAKPKRWGMGPAVMAGIGYGWGTDFKGGNCNGGLIAGFMIGWTLHYDVWQW